MAWMPGETQLSPFSKTLMRKVLPILICTPRRSQNIKSWLRRRKIRRKQRRSFTKPSLKLLRKRSHQHHSCHMKMRSQRKSPKSRLSLQKSSQSNHLSKQSLRMIQLTHQQPSLHRPKRKIQVLRPLRAHQHHQNRPRAQRPQLLARVHLRAQPRIIHQVPLLQAQGLTPQPRLLRAPTRQAV